MEFDNLVSKYLIEYKLPGGYADGLTEEQIAEIHDVSIEQIKNQLEKGIKIEYEHTDDEEIAREIAMDHLYELPDYYDRLIKMEDEAERKLKEAMTASAGGVFGDAEHIGHMGGSVGNKDFYAPGDTRVPKSLFGVLRRNEKKKRRKRKKKTDNDSSNT